MDVSDADAARVGRLRGGGVDVDTRRLGTVALIVVFVAVTVLGVGLAISVTHRHSQIDDLREHGVAVNITSTGCLGLLGGSGTNAAGYRCSGTFTYGGKHYAVTMPGTADHRPGTTVRAIAASDDPSLVTSVAEWRSDRASADGYLLPAALIVVGIGGGMGLVRQARRRQRAV